MNRKALPIYLEIRIHSSILELEFDERNNHKKVAEPFMDGWMTSKNKHTFLFEILHRHFPSSNVFDL